MALATILFISFVAFFSVVPQFTGHRSLPEQEMASRDLFVKSVRMMHREYVYVPPTRKSMVLDADGVAQRSADGTQMTKRDRTRKIALLPADIRIQEEPAPMTATVARVEEEPAAAPESPTIHFSETPLEVPSNPLQENAGVLERPAEAAPASEPAPEPFRGAGPLMPPPSPLAPEALQEPAAVVPEELPAEAEVLKKEEIRRSIHQAIMDDAQLSDSVKSTIDVILMRGVITLSGIVLQQEDRERLGALAQEIAGDEAVDNGLMVFNAS